MENLNGQNLLPKLKNLDSRFVRDFAISDSPRNTSGDCIQTYVASSLWLIDLSYYCFKACFGLKFFRNFNHVRWKTRAKSVKVSLCKVRLSHQSELCHLLTFIKVKLVVSFSDGINQILKLFEIINIV